MAMSRGSRPTRPDIIRINRSIKFGPTLLLGQIFFRDRFAIDELNVAAFGKNVGLMWILLA
jgi:hypothetical protein